MSSMRVPTPTIGSMMTAAALTRNSPGPKKRSANPRIRCPTVRNGNPKRPEIFIFHSAAGFQGSSGFFRVRPVWLSTHDCLMGYTGGGRRSRRPIAARGKLRYRAGRLPVRPLDSPGDCIAPQGTAIPGAEPQTLFMEKLPP